MEITVEVDTKSGFCYGVVQAIKEAENFLESNKKLYSLGSIVHNNTELNRLTKLGMNVITHKDMESLMGSVVFIRAHGEPPSSYQIAAKNNLKLIDCTCPVVLKLQEKIKKRYIWLKSVNGQLLIFGKPGHAEVNGLIGQVDGDAIIIEKIEDLESVDFSRPINIFSQTTKDPQEYKKVCNKIAERVLLSGAPIENFKSFNTICGQVSSRHPHLKSFSKKHSLIIFVTGKESSNGKILYESCKSVNPRSYRIECVDDINMEWLNDGDSVGVCGATSTPMWLLEEVAQFLSKKL